MKYKQTDENIERHQNYVVRPKLGVTSTNLLHHVKLFSKRLVTIQNNSVACTSLVTFQELLTEYSFILTIGFNEQPFQNIAKINPIQKS